VVNLERTAPSVTLVGFLLARIADTEHAGCLPKCVEPACVESIRAQCEAHRKIVETHKIGAFYVDHSILFSGEVQYAPDLVALASAYVDHPDYREEWRP
jgi:hypothetical protein